MAVVKFVAAKCPMSYIFKYVSNEAYLTYCTREDYEQQAGIRHG